MERTTTVLYQYCHLDKCFTILIIALISTRLYILHSSSTFISSPDQIVSFLTVGTYNTVMNDPLPFCMLSSQWCSYLPSNNMNMLLSRHKGDTHTISKTDVYLVTGEGSKACHTYLLAYFPWQPNTGQGLGTEYVTLE